MEISDIYYLVGRIHIVKEKKLFFTRLHVFHDVFSLFKSSPSFVYGRDP